MNVFIWKDCIIMLDKVKFILKHKKENPDYLPEVKDMNGKIITNGNDEPPFHFFTGVYFDDNTHEVFPLETFDGIIKALESKD